MMMFRRYAVSLFKILIYYLILFGVCRTVFLAYFFHEVVPEGTRIFFQSLWKALPLDLSAACYLLIIPLLLLLAEPWDKLRTGILILKIYLFITTFLIVLLSMSEIGVYQEMHVKLYYDLLSHLLHPGEILDTTSYGLIFVVLLLTSALTYLFFLMIQKLISPKTPFQFGPLQVISHLIVFFFSAGLLVMGARGGLQPIPINEGEVYFSRNQCVNDATVNPLWNIIHSYIENKLVLSGDAYKAMPDEQAGKIVQDLFSVAKDTTIQLFNTSRPNVCIIILESWSADVIASLGGYERLTPAFDSLVKDGYLFSNFRPAGHVSDQGIPAILSGYPALPIGSAINQPERQVQLPCLNTEFLKAGYTSSFYFGGQLIYGNIKAYTYRNKFSRVVEQHDLPANLPSGRLGIHDSVMFAIWADSLRQMQQPFFSNLFTLSSHSPFDIPAPYKIDWGGYYRPYLNSVAYTDRQLGVFFEKVKSQPWYQNTIFIIVADHSHGTPKNYDYCSPEMYHIPLLITGGALKNEFRGQRNHQLGSQTDIAATLLKQLSFSSKDYPWSKNLMNPYTRKFAFYTFNEGFGYLEDDKRVVWNKKFPHMNQHTATGGASADSLQIRGAAMLQVLMKNFLSK